MEDQVFQIQKMLANKLNVYKERGNSYVNDNIWEIQELYKDEEQKEDKGTIEDEKVILIKLYEISKSTFSIIKSSFIDNEVKNLIKYIKFI